MYSTLITAVALFAAPAFAAFAINSPDLKQCEESRISWEKTKGPYNLIAVNAAEPCGEPLVEIGDFEGTSILWTTTIPAGSVIQLSVADADDEEAWSRNITVGAGSSSCLTPANGATTPETPDSTTTTTTTTDSTTGSGTDTTTDENGEIIPVGAANAGSNKIFNDNAAPSARSLSTSAMALGAIAAVAALAL